MTERPLRVLFLLSHLAHLRKFEAALSEMGERGYAVHVSCGARPAKATMAVAERLSRRYPTIRIDDALRQASVRWPFNALSVVLRRLSSEFRHLSPRYEAYATVRDDAAGRWPGPVLRGYRFVQARWPAAIAALRRFVEAAERALPVHPAVVGLLTDERPDVVLVSPLVAGWFLGDYVRAAARLGIPTSLSVASWDNLTTKGLLSAPPDQMIVWNETQRAEAADEFAYPASRVVVTGAHAFDHWFHATARPRETFCRAVGLDPDRPYVLYVGSSRRIARDETGFVDAWVRSLRESGDARLAEIGVLVRPHYQNPDAWQAWRPSDPRVVVWPRDGEDPVTEAARANYFDAMFHSVAVVGVNTTALIESGIVGRPVLTVVTARFGQEGMPHFHYLVDQGLVRVARSVEEHRRQLTAVLDAGANGVAPDGFLSTFVRPFGREAAAAPRFVAAVEALTSVEAGALDRTPRGVARLAWTLPLAILAAAVWSWRTTRHVAAGVLRPVRGASGVEGSVR